MLRFCTTVLGLVKDKHICDGPIPLLDREFAGRRARCGTGSGADEFSAAADLSKALFAAGIPATAFLSEDIQAEFAR